jgi:hypothetical protein
MILSQARASDAFRHAVIDRRLLLLGCALASIALRPSRAEQPTSSNEATLGKAVGVLAHEKSAAEQYAAILATVGKSDIALYVRGIQLYADAKAEFDALIAELKFDLNTGKDPARSALFNGALQGAAEKRVAFTCELAQRPIRIAFPPPTTPRDCGRIGPVRRLGPPRKPTPASSSAMLMGSRSPSLLRG